MLPRLSWARIRAAVLLLGTPFVALSLAGACLDYAGEDLFLCEQAGSGEGSGSASGSGSDADAGSGGEDEPDCGAAAPSPGSGSGSGSGS